MLAPAARSTAPTLEVSEPSDPAELEAERAAAQVMRMLSSGTPPEDGLELSPACPARLHRTAEDAASATPPEPAGGFLVEDEAKPLPGQMHKTEFLAALRPAVCTAADRELARVGRSSAGCPYLDRWFDYYAGRDARQVERALRKYAPATEGARSARDYIAPVSERVAQGVRRWADTGEVPELPEGVSPDMMEGGGVVDALAQVGSAIGGAIMSGLSAIGRLFFKADAPGGNPAVDRGALSARLGEGRPLDGAARARMGSAFGYDFGAVRVHDDASAAALADRLDAQAFTLGTHVAFGAGRYKPGEPVGDALLAHELAHVVQQGGGTPEVSPDAADSALEADADAAAEAAVVSLWSGAAGLEPEVRRRPPRLRGGIRLARCHPQRGPVTPVAPGALAQMTPWELAHAPESAVAGNTDYTRARLVAQRTFASLGVSHDVDRGTIPPLGAEPTAAQLRIVDAQLRAVLGQDGIQSLVSSGRIPMAGDPPRPSLEGRVRLPGRRDFMIKQYEHTRWFYQTLTVDQDQVRERLRGAWTDVGYTETSQLTPQEILLSIWLDAPAAGFYNPVDDRFYLAPDVDLSDPANLEIVRHETTHMLGGRDATLRAFEARLRPTQGARWFDYWEAFEEGIAQIVALDSAPPGTPPRQPATTSSTTTSGGTTTTVTVSSEGAYPGQVAWIRSIMAAASGNRALLLRAYFSGSIGEDVFSLLLDEARFGRPPRAG